MLILDSSGSMWGQVDGVAKYQVARKVIGNVLQDIGQNVNMGVMAYGHRRKGDCTDIQTVIPVGKVNAPRYMSSIRKINPKGKTPISAAVRQAAETLRFTEEKATIVLISDGLETCDADPCALSAELEKLGIDFTVHVVGFDLGNEDTRTLSCLADNTGGMFLQAGNANELTDAIGQVVEVVKEAPAAPKPAPAPKPEPVAGPTQILPRAFLNEGGERLNDAYFRVYAIEQDAEGNRKQITYGGGKPKLKVPPGKYYITAKRGGALAGMEFEIAEGKQNVVEIVLNAGIVVPKAFWTEGGEPVKDAYFRLYDAATDADGNRKQVTYGGGKPKFTVAAGEYYITAKVGDALIGKTVEVSPGEVIDIALVLGAGILRPSAYYSEGGDPVKGAYFRVYELQANADGQRKQVTYGGGKPKFKLPAGAYYITAKVGDALIGREIEITAGEAVDVALILNAGVLVPTAYYAEGEEPVKDAYFRVYEQAQNADGQRKQVTYGGGKPKFKLPAGNYYITAKVGDALIGRDVEVTGGEATEVSLVLGAGVLIPTAHFTQGGDPAKGAYFRVYEAEPGVDGQRKQVTYGGGKPKFKLPAGTYYITAKIGEAIVGQNVEVVPGQSTDVAIVLEAGVLSLFASAAEGGDPVKKAYFRVFAAKKDIEGNRKQVASGGGKPKFKLPAGQYVATVTWGDARAQSDVTVSAGELTETTLNLNAGRLVATAINAEGGQQVTKRVYFRVFAAKKDIEGNRKQVSSGGGKKFGANLPVGAYIVQVTVGGGTKSSGTVEVNITAGELTEVAVPVQASQQ